MSFKAESLSFLVLLELYQVLQIKIFHNLPTSRLEIHGSCSCRSHIPNSSHLGPRQGAQLDLTPFQVHGEVTSDCAADFLKKQEFLWILWLAKCLRWCQNYFGTCRMILNDPPNTFKEGWFQKGWALHVLCDSPLVPWLLVALPW